MNFGFSSTQFIVIVDFKTEFYFGEILQLIIKV